MTSAVARQLLCSYIQRLAAAFANGGVKRAAAFVYEDYWLLVCGLLWDFVNLGLPQGGQMSQTTSKRNWANRLRAWVADRRQKRVTPSPQVKPR